MTVISCVTYSALSLNFLLGELCFRKAIYYYYYWWVCKSCYILVLERDFRGRGGGGCFHTVSCQHNLMSDECLTLLPRSSGNPDIGLTSAGYLCRVFPTLVLISQWSYVTGKREAHFFSEWVKILWTCCVCVAEREVWAVWPQAEQVGRGGGQLDLSLWRSQEWRTGNLGTNYPRFKPSQEPKKNLWEFFRVKTIVLTCQCAQPRVYTHA